MITSKRFNYIMTFIFVLTIVGSIGMAYVGNGYLQTHAQKLKEVKLESALVENEQFTLQKSKADLEQYSDILDVVQRAIPTDKNQASIVLELTNIAKKAGIGLKTIQFPTSDLGAPKGTASAPATSAVGAADASGAAASGGTAQSQITPVQGLSGVGAIKIQVSPLVDDSHKVSYNQMITFLRLIEQNERMMQVSDLHLSPQGKKSSDSIAFTVDLNVFTKLEGATQK